MKKMIISISLISMILLTISGIAFPWEIDNHKRMSEKSVNISQLPDYLEKKLGFPFLLKQFQGPAHSKNKWGIEEFANDMNYTATEWIKHGSGAEDEFFVRWLHFPHYGKDMRPVNHFYNPFWDNLDVYPYPDDGWGNDWNFQEGGLYDDIASGVAGVDLYAGKPLLRWGYDGCPDTPPNSTFTRSDDNYFSWIMARKYFYAALSGDSTELNGIGGVEGKTNMNENERNRCFALLFRSLGQLLHLVQDAGQPEHTRNDAHPLSGFWGGFEHYATKYNCTSPSCSSVTPWQSIVKSDNVFSDFIDSNLAGGGYDPGTSTGLAEFSNYNFFTKDSIADNIMHDYCEPDCEPHGHERHRFFTSPRVNEDLFTLEEALIYNTYYYWSEPIVDPLGMTPATSIRLAKRRWYHNLLVLYGWNDYTTEDPKIWDDYFDLLIPKCIGYSAGLLDYFFRGTIEISDFDIQVDIDPGHYQTKVGFNKVTLYAKNTSLPDTENMDEGTVHLVVKYKVDENERFLHTPPHPSMEFQYITKQFEDDNNENPLVHSIPSDDPKQFAFDLSDNPIPLNATDIYLYLVYRGQLGMEADGVGVGHAPLIEFRILEAGLSDEGVYALTDQDPAAIDPTTQGFDSITLSAKNIDPDNRDMSDGTVQLIVKYLVAQEDQFQNPPPYPSFSFHYIIKELPNQTIPRITPDPIKFEFDLSDSQIPLWATDIYLYLVYKGQLGLESGAVAVGFKDISEPTKMSYYNCMDKVCIRGNMYDAGDEAYNIAVDEGKEDEWDVYSHDRQNVYIKYSSYEDPQSLTPAFDNCNYHIPYQAAGEYTTLFIITDYQFAENHSDGEIVATDPRDDFDHYAGNYIGGIWGLTAIKNQIEVQGPASPYYDPDQFVYIRYIPPFSPFRDIQNSWGVFSLSNRPLPEGHPDNVNCSY